MPRINAWCRRFTRLVWTKPPCSLHTAFTLCILLGGASVVWYVFFRTALSIEQLTEGEQVIGKCFAVARPGSLESCEAVFRVAGSLRQRDVVAATFYSVQNGTVREISRINIGLPSRVDMPTFLASRFDVRFALCECSVLSSPAVALGVDGRKSAVGSGAPLLAQRRATNANVLAGNIPRGQPVVVYVEGDSATVQPMMGISDFALSNDAGDYVVITMKIE